MRKTISFAPTYILFILAIIGIIFAVFWKLFDTKKELIKVYENHGKIVFLGNDLKTFLRHGSYSAKKYASSGLVKFEKEYLENLSIFRGQKIRPANSLFYPGKRVNFKKLTERVPLPKVETKLLKNTLREVESLIDIEKKAVREYDKDQMKARKILFDSTNELQREKINTNLDVIVHSAYLKMNDLVGNSRRFSNQIFLFGIILIGFLACLICWGFYFNKKKIVNG